MRGVFDYGRDKGDAGSTAFAGERLKHYFYGGDVQLRTPSGFAPCLLAGAGAVTVDGPTSRPAVAPEFIPGTRNR